MNKIILLVIAMSLVLVSCGTEIVRNDEATGGFDYSIVVIENMPCIVVTSYTYYGYRVDSVSCDWSKWEGN